MRAIRFRKTGGPEVLESVAMDLPEPPAGCLRIKHGAVGLNFIDTYHRSGLYPAPLPCVPGLEAAGRVEALGPGVQGFAAGDRVAYATAPLGAYAESANLPARIVVRIPDDISEEIAAAMLLKGMTAYYLLHQTYPLKAGETVVIYAAAGGVGSIACQWAKKIGATVIGIVGSDEKAGKARALGCDHVVVYTREKVAEAVLDLTGGRGVPVVYDSVGKDSFEASLRCLSVRGLLVSFGNASGPPPALNLQDLALGGSLFVTRPTLASYTRNPAELNAAASALFNVVSEGSVQIEIGRRYALEDAVEAHRDLEARRTTTSSVLIP